MGYVREEGGCGLRPEFEAELQALEDAWVCEGSDVLQVDTENVEMSAKDVVAFEAGVRLVLEDGCVLRKGIVGRLEELLMG